MKSQTIFSLFISLVFSFNLASAQVENSENIKIPIDSTVTVKTKYKPLVADNNFEFKLSTSDNATNAFYDKTFHKYLKKETKKNRFSLNFSQRLPSYPPNDFRSIQHGPNPYIDRPTVLPSFTECVIYNLAQGLLSNLR